MFTGIVRGVFKIAEAVHQNGVLSYAVEFQPDLLKGLSVGASVSIDGVCQTVTRIDGNRVWFDAIPETLNRTTLANLSIGHSVNVERSAKIGDEIGGHLLSGHVFGTATIEHKSWNQSSCVLQLRCPASWMKFFFPKGFIALNGASLTLVNVNPNGLFSVHLIPETLKATTFSIKEPGCQVNVEFDAQTQAIVDTVERTVERLYERKEGGCPPL